MYFPVELWSLIKDFQIEHKKHHINKLQKCLPKINYLFGPIYSRMSVVSFPPKRYKSFNHYEIVDGQFIQIEKEYPLISIEQNLTKCSNYARKYQPYFVKACYGWANLRRLPFNKL